MSSNSLSISQEKFIGGNPSNPEQTWWVPVYLSPRPDQSLPSNFPDRWIPPNTTSISIQMDTSQVIIVNPWAFGYYRVLYEGELLTKIFQQLADNHEGISATGRSVLLNDYATFVLHGYAEAKTFRRLCEYLEKETEFVVWSNLSPKIKQISNLLEGTLEEKEFKAYFGEKAYNAFLKISKNAPESEWGEKAMLKTLLVDIACQFGYKSCIEDLSKIVNYWVVGRSSVSIIPLSLQEPAFCAAVQRDSDNSYWNFFQGVVDGTKGFSPLRQRLLRSLGCSSSVKNIQLLIKKMKNGEFSPEEETELLDQITKNKLGCKIVIDELKQSDSLWQLQGFQVPKTFKTVVDNILSFIWEDGEIQLLRNVAPRLDQEKRIILENAITKGSQNKVLFQRFQSFSD